MKRVVLGFLLVVIGFVCAIASVIYKKQFVSHGEPLDPVLGCLWAVAGVSLPIGALLCRMSRSAEIDGNSPRGFEVKLITGAEPVLTQKEHDHG